MEDNTVTSMFAMSIALFCLLAQTACAIWAPQSVAAIQHPSDVLMGGCLGVIMGSIKKS